MHASKVCGLYNVVILLNCTPTFESHMTEIVHSNEHQILHLDNDQNIHYEENGYGLALI